MLAGDEEGGATAQDRSEISIVSPKLSDPNSVYSIINKNQPERLNSGRHVQPMENTGPYGLS